MSALVLRNEPLASARSVVLSVFDPSLGRGADPDTDLTGCIYISDGTPLLVAALGAFENIRRPLVIADDVIESVDTGLDQVVLTGHLYQNLDGPFDADEVVGTINGGDDIWIIYVDENTVAFANSLANAIAGTRVALIGGETGATIADNASTERAIRGKWLYTLTSAETLVDAPELDISIQGHEDDLEGGASVTLQRSGSSVWTETGPDGISRGSELTLAARTAAAKILIDTETGGYVVRDIPDTLDSHGGTLTEDGRIEADIIDPSL